MCSGTIQGAKTEPAKNEGDFFLKIVWQSGSKTSWPFVICFVDVVTGCLEVFGGFEWDFNQETVFWDEKSSLRRCLPQRQTSTKVQVLG